MFVHLVYLDDSGSEKDSKTVMVGALLIPENQFGKAETIAGMVIDTLINKHDVQGFKEFHAYELFNGDGVFKQVEECHRYEAIRVLLRVVEMLHLTFVYSAVDIKAHSETAFGGGHPVDLAFRMCLRGVEDRCILELVDLWLPIMDETKDAALKSRLKTSFRSMRHKMLPPYDTQKLNRCHDDMYFADSTDSIGVQLSDLCSYFVCRNINGLTDRENFYRIISEAAICSKVNPEWSNLGVFREAKLGQ
jgi:Protein of unknown function (DUF3800)